MLQWRKRTAQQRQDRCSDTSAPSCSVINNYTLTATLWSLALAQGFKYFDSMEIFFFCLCVLLFIHFCLCGHRCGGDYTKYENNSARN